MIETRDLQVGATYRGKRSRRLHPFTDERDDRTIIWISADGERLQYDSPTVGVGRHYPMTTTDKFLRWAKCEVTPR